MSDRKRRGMERYPVPDEADDDTTDKHLTDEFWDAYTKAPVFRREFFEERPRRETNHIYPDEDFARWTADAIGCQPSDWDNPKYQQVYKERLIIAETANTFWVVAPGRGGAKSLDRFIEQHRGTHIKVHKHDPVKDMYALEISPEIARQMREMGFDMSPIKPGGDNRRAR